MVNSNHTCNYEIPRFGGLQGQALLEAFRLAALSHQLRELVRNVLGTWCFRNPPLTLCSAFVVQLLNATGKENVTFSQIDLVCLEHIQFFLKKKNPTSWTNWKENA